MHLVERTDNNNLLFQLVNVLYSPWQRPAGLHTMAAFQFVHLHCPAKIPMPQNKLSKNLLLIAMWIQYATYCAPSCTLMNITNVGNCQCQMYKLKHTYVCIQYNNTDNRQQNQYFDCRLSTKWNVEYNRNVKGETTKKQREERSNKKTAATTLAATITTRHEEMKWNTIKHQLAVKTQPIRWEERSSNAYLSNICWNMKRLSSYTHTHCYTNIFQTNCTESNRNDPNRTWHELSWAERNHTDEWQSHTYVHTLYNFILFVAKPDAHTTQQIVSNVKIRFECSWKSFMKCFQRVNIFIWRFLSIYWLLFTILNFNAATCWKMFYTNSLGVCFMYGFCVLNSHVLHQMRDVYDDTMYLYLYILNHFFWFQVEWYLFCCYWN